MLTSTFSSSDEPTRRSRIGTVILTILSALMFLWPLSQTNVRLVPSRFVKGNKLLAKSILSAAKQTACRYWSKILACRKYSSILSKLSISCLFWLEMVYFRLKQVIVSRSWTEPMTDNDLRSRNRRSIENRVSRIGRCRF